MATATDAPRKMRWGFMSTAAITAKNAKALARAESDGELYAVASRDLAKAKETAARYGAPVAYGSYEELLADPQVDAVYIPLPCAMHKQWVSAAAAAKKHVLVEKPTATSTAELCDMLRTCRAHGVQWMDGVMFMHHTRLPALLSHACSPECAPAPAPARRCAHALGALRRVTSGFSFLADEAFLRSNIRMDPALEPYGALGDLGWYNIRLAIVAFRGDVPTHVRAVSHTPPAASLAGVTPRVPLEVSATLYFTGGRVSSFDCSFTHGFRQWAELAGDTGRATLDDFCLPRGPESALFELASEMGLVDDHCRVAGRESVVDTRDCVQETAMFARFAAAVRAGGDDEWPRMSLKTQAVMDACMHSLLHDGAHTPVTVPTVD